MGTQNGSRANHNGRLVNRTNNCGGDNKAGLPSRIGPIANRLQLNCKTQCALPKECVVKKAIRMYYRVGRKYLG